MTMPTTLIAKAPDARGWWLWQKIYAGGRWIVSGAGETREEARMQAERDHAWIWADRA